MKTQWDFFYEQENQRNQEDNRPQLQIEEYQPEIEEIGNNEQNRGVAIINFG